MGPPLIQLSDLSKTYREGEQEHQVLQNIHLEIKQGEILVLLGRSGSGKSTLLNLLSGIDLPTAGEIFINNENLTRFSERDRTLFRREHIGFVFQFFNLIPTLTVEENLLLPLELNGKLDEVSRKKSLELLEEVGLGNRANSFPDRLSGGEQQRVAIARALIHDPLIILADEPTGNLDYDTGLQVIKLLDRMVRAKGKTMIMATHSREVIGLADRIFSVKEGKLAEVSREESVFKQ